MRFTVLDSWRGVCALWVAIYHFRIVSNIHTVDLFRHGSLAVEFFFVLSGFVLTCAYGDRISGMRDRLRFMIRRFGRLYPLHLVTLLGVVALESGRWLISQHLGREVGGALFVGPTDPAALLPNLLLIHGTGILRDFTWNVPSWSISVEFVLCAVFLGALAFPNRLAALVGFMIAGLGAYLYTRYGIADQSESTTALARGVYSFFLGALVFKLYSRWRDRGKTPPGWLEWLAVPIFLVVPWLDHSPAPALLFAGLIFIFAFEFGPISRAMKIPSLMKLGEISYSIYLVHYLIVLVAFGFASIAGRVVDINGAPWMSSGSVFLGDLITMAYCGVVIGVSLVTYRWIESPGRDFFNGLSRRI